MDKEFNDALDDYARAACNLANSMTPETVAAFVAAFRHLRSIAKERFGSAAFALVQALVRNRYDRATRQAINAAWRLKVIPRERHGAPRRGGGSDGLSVRSS